MLGEPTVSILGGAHLEYDLVSGDWSMGGPARRKDRSHPDQFTRNQGIRAAYERFSATPGHRSRLTPQYKREIGQPIGPMDWYELQRPRAALSGTSVATRRRKWTGDLGR